MTLIRFPSVQLDNVYEDILDATQAVCEGTVVGPVNLGTGGTFTIAVDGGSAQTITIAEAQFDDLTSATLAEIAAAINSQLTGAVATVETTGLFITSNLYGATSELIVTNGTLAIVVTLGFGATSSVTVNGTDATSTVALVNRNPEPDAIAIPSNSQIYFELASTTGTSPTDADVTIKIGGVTAWDGAVWGNGYTGGFWNPQADVLAVSITPDAVFTSTELISIQVIVTSPAALDETYAFTAADSVEPYIAAVQGRDATTLRVTFSEDVVISSPSNSNDALNPGNYTLERLSRPAVSATITAVNQYSANTVDLTTDIELTFGAPYMLLVASIEDSEGNSIIAPNNTYTFTAYIPPFPNGRRFRLIDFIPDINRGEDPTRDLEVFIGVFQEIVNLLLVSIDKWTEIFDIDVASEAFLDSMLEDLGNPFTEFDLSEVDKRRLLRVLIDIYKLKGTARGIIDVIRFFLSLDVTIEIFNDFAGWELTAVGADSAVGTELSAIDNDGTNPSELSPNEAGVYSFVIDSPSVILTDEQRERITSIANLMKPAHTHLIAITDPTPEIPVDHLELGYSELGSYSVGGTAGTFILHEP